MRMVISLVFGLLLAASCAAEVETTSEGEPLRGPLGKADRIGSCGEAEVCDGPAPLGNCFCDPECVAYGDCCEDRLDYCPEAEESTCGGPQDLECGEGEYCHFGNEAPACGEGGALGTCVAKPQFCTQVYEPVCGCDGETYSNECKAHAAGVNVVAHTTCDELSKG